MHELSIAQGIVDILLEQMRAHDLSEIANVSMRIGALRAVDKDSLGFSFDLLTADSPLKGARLDIEDIPIQGRCLQCSQELLMGSWLDDCPSCGSTRVEVISGKELEITGLEGT
jgi:hydrogenase nickel incorporation protein HypA/HybF